MILKHLELIDDAERQNQLKQLKSRLDEKFNSMNENDLATAMLQAETPNNSMVVDDQRVNYHNRMQRYTR